MKAPSLRGRKAALPGKVNVALSRNKQQLQQASQPTAERQIVESLSRINTTQLEGLALASERSTSLNEFERSAILKGIAAELAERTAEKVELRKGDR